jgi:hypothetical protein
MIASLTEEELMMKRFARRGVTLGLLMLATSGCGKELGRVPFAAEGKGDTSAPLAAGNVQFWADLDIEYKGNAVLAYQIELLQNGAVVGTTTCNPLGPMTVKVSWVETNLGGSHSRRGSGKMGCSSSVPKGGPTTVRATLAFAQKPATLTFKKADLVVKQ